MKSTDSEPSASLSKTTLIEIIDIADVIWFLTFMFLEWLQLYFGPLERAIIILYV